MSPGARQHYHPASFVARFSADSYPKARRRRLFVAQRNGKLFHVAAENAAFVRHLYTDLVDSIWAEYEERLPSALDALCTPATELDGNTWLRVLVPFVAAVLLRGPDFENRFTERAIHQFGDELRERVEDTAGEARVMELQRLLAPVLAARWVVMHVSGNTPVITSDVGWAPYADPVNGQMGFAIPLNPKTILGLVPRRTRFVLFWNGRAWSPLIDHRELSHNNHLPLPRLLAGFAYRQVFGPTPESVRGVLDILDRKPIAPAEPFPFAPLGGVNGPPNEFTWHRLVAALKKTPGDPSLAEFPFDIEALTDGWTPPLMFPVNLPEFPPALRLKGNIIEVALFTVFSADPTRWVLRQDVPMSYPPAPPSSFYAAYQSFLQERKPAKLAPPQSQQGQIEFAPGLLGRAVENFAKKRPRNK